MMIGDVGGDPLYLLHAMDDFFRVSKLEMY